MYNVISGGHNTLLRALNIIAGVNEIYVFDRNDVVILLMLCTAQYRNKKWATSISHVRKCC